MTTETTCPECGVDVNDLTAEIDKLRAALRTADYEFTTLIPRLTDPYRRNVEAAREAVRAALNMNKARTS